ncbi:MAG: M28 family peptidase [Gemmatimonadales bacterium]|nr:M28 family peptidase [Gemmatimonadales bacterium]
MRRLILPILLLSAQSAPAAAQSAVIDSAVISAHTRFLADDVLRGRATGTEGARVAALYLESQCRALGLLPVGASYRHPVPLEEATILPATRLTVSGGRGSVDFLYLVDFLPNVGSKAALSSFAGTAVFVGPEQSVAGGRLGTLELAGRVAVTVGPFRGPALDTLIDRGAIGMVHLVMDPATYQLYVRSRGPSRLYHRDPDTPSSFLPSLPAMLAGPRVGRVLLDGIRVGEDGEPFPQLLAWGVEADIVTSVRPIDDTNVACLIPGAGAQARDTAITLTAHYDHLGVSTPDAAGDSIYNGFSDDAAGAAMLLAVATALQRGQVPALAHSLILLFFTGEERGLLGSDAYVAAPAWPLTQVLAVINLDAGAPPGKPVSWRLAGVDSTGLGAVASRVADRLRWRVTTSAAQANSDYFPFHRHGVPAVFIIPGSEPYEGLDTDGTTALRQRWDHYHQAADGWSPDFPFEGLVRYAEFALLLAREVDAHPQQVR